MNTLQTELLGNNVAITFRPEEGQALSWHISIENAAELACLMLRAGNIMHAANIAIPGMTLQVEGGRYRRAWLGMSHNSAPDLIACIRGRTVWEVGRCLHDHYLRAMDASLNQHERAIYVRAVSYFYLDTPE